MTKRVFLALVLVTTLGVTLSMHAQQPIIYGINQSNGSYPEAYTYWSIYGQNLSTVTSTSCSSQGSSITWNFPEICHNETITLPCQQYPTINGWPYILMPQNTTNACSDPSYWYESSSQINFYANVIVPVSPVVDFTPADPLTNYGQKLSVCNSLGLCSSQFNYN